MLEHCARVLSVWEIAHRWYRFDPDASDKEIPLEVKDLLRIISKRLVFHEITICNHGGVEQWNTDRIPEEYDYNFDMNMLPLKIECLEMVIDCLYDCIQLSSEYWICSTDIKKCSLTQLGKIARVNEHEKYSDYVHERSKFHDEKVESLDKCYIGRVFDKSILDDILLDRNAVAKLCGELEEVLPEFWFGSPGSTEYEFFETKMNPKKMAFCTRQHFDFDTSEYHTEPYLEKIELILNASLDVLDKFWKNYDPEDRKSSPKSDDITDYLEETYNKNLSIRDQKVIQAAVRDPRTKKGGMK